MDAGPGPVTAAAAVPAAPTAESAPLPVSVSRYRSLRGKSVSSPHPSLRSFDVFEDSRDGDEPDPDTPSRRRRRSKSAAGDGSVRGGRRAGFSTSASALSPKPINLLLATKKNGGKKNDDAAVKAWAADLRPPPPLPIDTARLQALNKRAADKDKALAESAAESPPASPVTPSLSPLDFEVSTAPLTPTTPSGPFTPLTPVFPFEARPKEADDGEESRWAEEVARLEAETDRILAEQKKRDLARLHAQVATPPPKAKSIILERLTFFSRSVKKGYPRSQPGTPTSITSTIFSLDFSRAGSLETSPVPDKMSFIEQGGGGIVPQTDAPTSAVNGGERVSASHIMSPTN